MNLTIHQGALIHSTFPIMALTCTVTVILYFGMCVHIKVSTRLLSETELKHSEESMAAEEKTNEPAASVSALNAPAFCRWDRLDTDWETHPTCDLLQKKIDKSTGILIGSETSFLGQAIILCGNLNWQLLVAINHLSHKIACVCVQYVCLYMSEEMGQVCSVRQGGGGAYGWEREVRACAGVGGGRKQCEHR